MKKLQLLASILLIVIIAILGIAFWGCENPTDVTTSIEGAPGNAQLTGTIHGIVRDFVTTEPIEGAQISYVQDSNVETVSTNSQGYYSIDNLSIGTYDLECTANDTIHVGASHIVTVSFYAGPDTMEYLGGNTYHLYYVEDIPLCPLTAGLNGQVYAALDVENSVPAAGAVVEADFTDWMVHPAIFTTTADANGAFTFANLPATPNVDLRVLPFTYQNITFAVNVMPNVALVPSATVEPQAIIITPAATTPAVVTNNFLAGNVELDQNLILTFSVAMDSNQTQVVLQSPNLPYSIACAVTWDAAYVTMTIDPTLLLRPGVNYYLTVISSSQAGAYFQESFDIATIPGIQFVQTNIEEYEGVQRTDFGLAEAIWVTFSQSADPTNPDNDFQLWQNYQGYRYEVYCEVSWSNGNTTVTLTPLQPMIPNTWYDLDVDVYSTVPNDHAQYSGSFRTTDLANAPLAPTGFTLLNATSINFDTNPLLFSWNTQEGVENYHLYARNDAEYPTWLKIETIPSDYPNPQQSATIWLPAFYDYLLGDPLGQTPFANGTQMFFRLTAANTAGESEFSTERIAQDVLAPIVFDINQSGPANNTFGSEADTIWVDIGLNEYGEPTSTPTRWFVDGGDPTYTIDNAFWEWDSDNFNTSGSWRIVIPDSTDGSGDYLYMIGIEDNSGNSSADTVSYQLW